MIVEKNPFRGGHLAYPHLSKIANTPKRHSANFHQLHLTPPDSKCRKLARSRGGGRETAPLPPPNCASVLRLAQLKMYIFSCQFCVAHFKIYFRNTPKSSVNLLSSLALARRGTNVLSLLNLRQTWIGNLLIDLVLICRVNQVTIKTTDN